MKKLKRYLSYSYPVRILREPDGVYCAEVEDIEGLCAYGETPTEAVEQLQTVQSAAFELMLSQGKTPPVPKVKLEIPEDVFRRLPERKKLKQYVKA